MRFSKGVYGDDKHTTPITSTAFSVVGTNSILGLNITGKDTGGGAVEAELTLSRPLSANEAYGDRIKAATGASVYDEYGTPMDATAQHRITDIGIGLLMPVWATDGVHGNTTTTGTQGALTVFDGTGYLLPTTVTVQAAIQASNYQSLPTSLAYDVNPPSASVVAGFWLPTIIPGLLGVADTDARSVLPQSAQGNLRNFAIPGSDPEVKTGNTMQFVLKLGDLYCAQITDPNNILSLAPWSFQYRDITVQRGEVTILNNVINPDNHEQTFLKYHLATAGNTTIEVFGLDGTLVKILFRGRQGSGDYTIPWDGTNESGRPVARGIYFIKIVAPAIDETRKVLIER